jgi:hypothetical protein
VCGGAAVPVEVRRGGTSRKAALTGRCPAPPPLPTSDRNGVDLSDGLRASVPGGLLPGVLVADQVDFLSLGKIPGIRAVNRPGFRGDSIP